MSLLTIPPELHLHIGQYLTWQDLYALIRSHSYLAAVHNHRLLPVAARDDGQTPLLWAAKVGNEQLIRQLLNEYNVPTHLVDENRITALHVAAQRGDTAIIGLLLEKGAHALTNYQRSEMDSRDGGYPEGMTAVMPIHLAAFHGHADIVRLLAIAGGKPRHRGSFLRNARVLDITVAQGHEELAEMIVMELGAKEVYAFCTLARVVYPTWNEKMVRLLLGHAESKPSCTLWYLRRRTSIEANEFSRVRGKLVSVARELGVRMNEVCTYWYGCGCGCPVK